MHGSIALRSSTLAVSHGRPSVQVAAGPRAHLVGIAGTGMRALADVLTDSGYTVSGSDPRAHLMDPTRYRVARDHRAEAIDSTVDLVIHSDAVPQDNPELWQARKLGVRVVSYPEFLGELMASRRGVAIAGTHGKSTTAAMAAEILSAAGLDPTVIFGATALAPGAGSRLGRGRWMLAEACEYRANFRHLAPQVAAVLGIELDHVDCFASLAEVEQAFVQFVRRVPAAGHIVASADCAATRRVTRGLDATVETFGLSPSATWQATALRERRGCYSFQLGARQRRVCEVKLTVPGRHNVYNALAAAAVAHRVGAAGSAIRAGLERFAGLRRRLEIVADDGSLAVVDDYAHHPTAVAAALATVRQMYPGRRLVCCFEPHQASRVRRLLDDFARVLHNADKIIVTEVFPAREEPDEFGNRSSAATLVESIVRLGGEATALDGAAHAADRLVAMLVPGDVLLTLGAGDVGAIAHDVGQRIRAIRKAG
jgi:UDP-N-acetylmuramate--alanine ligase